MKAARALHRREFLRRVALSGGALAIAGPVAARFAGAFANPAGVLKAALGAPSPASPPAAVPAPVVTFFDGALWFDPSGTSAAYEPPLGARGGAHLALLSDEELLSTRLYI